MSSTATYLVLVPRHSSSGEPLDGQVMQTLPKYGSYLVGPNSGSA